MAQKKKITRRDFMKKVGKGAAVVGMAGMMPPLAKTVWAAEKDHILIGRPLPMTGPVAAFSEAAPWIDNKALDAINKEGGIYIEEYGKKLPLKVKILDTESNPTKAAELAGKLVLQDKIDLMYVSNTPATCSPTTAVCERYKIPCVITNMPIEMWIPGGPFHWSFDASTSVMDFTASFLQAWNAIDTNKVVGLLAQNDADGMAWANGAQAALNPAGYTVIDLGRFPVGTPDYSVFINGFKKEKVEVVFANMAPPDFATFWRQCFQMGFLPKACTVGRATSFPSAVEALGGDLGLGTSSELPWHPAFPFKSSLENLSAQKLADDFEERYKKQWTAPLGSLYAGYEILADVLKRAKTLDKEKIRNAFSSTNLDTIIGHVKFNEKNFAILPSGALQWVKGDKWKYECALVANGKYPELPVRAKMRSIRELRGVSG